VNSVANRKRYKILGGLIGGLFITSAVAWMPLLMNLLEQMGYSHPKSEIISYAILFLVSAMVSYLFVTELIKARIQKRRCDEILDTSMIFELHNKQFFYTMLKKQIYLAKRNRWSVSMIAFYIEPINRHKSKRVDISSQIKEIVVNELERYARCSDQVGSFAKNEYLVFLQNCSKDNAVRIAERFKERLSSRYVTIEGNTYKLECKCGVASLEPAAAEAKRLVELAYEAMDKAAEKPGSVIETK